MKGLRTRCVGMFLALTALGACSAAPRPAEEALKNIKKPDVIYVPTPQEVVEMMLHLARVKPGDVVYDLGCGDGRVVVTVAKRYGCKAVGYDIDPDRVRESRQNVRENGIERLARIEQKDIFTLDLSGADVIFLYLLPELNVRLIPQLEKLKPGARVVSHDFNMRGVRPDAVVSVWSRGDSSSHRIYLWNMPFMRVQTTEVSEVAEDDPWDEWEEDWDEDKDEGAGDSFPDS